MTRLDRRPVLGSVVHEHARDGVGQRGRTADDRLDAGGLFAFPVRTDDQVEAGLGVVGLADLRELVRARVVHRVDPEAVAEVRDLDDDRLFVEREEAEAVDDILIRTGDEVLPGIDVVAQHPDLPARRDRQHAVEPAGLGRLRDGGAAIDLVDHRPAPDIGHAADRLGVFRMHHDARGRRCDAAAVCGAGTCWASTASRRQTSRCEQQCGERHICDSDGAIGFRDACCFHVRARLLDCVDYLAGAGCGACQLPAASVPCGPYMRSTM